MFACSLKNRMCSLYNVCLQIIYIDIAIIIFLDISNQVQKWICGLFPASIEKLMVKLSNKFKYHTIRKKSLKK